MSVQNPHLFIQIPCFNEEQTLGETLRDIPQKLKGVGKISILVIDDGSVDLTTQIAFRSKRVQVLRLKVHRGLARAFSAGLQFCLEGGADIIVNLDADNQYQASSLQDLINPILDGRADITLGARNFESIQEFSRIKRFFQRLGSRVMSQLCRVSIPDAATGFRAFSREAALKLQIFTKYTYTLEMLIHGSQLGQKMISVPIRTNPVRRPSRLFRHPVSYIARNSGALLRIIFLYNPLRILGWSSFLVSLGAASFGILGLEVMAGVCILVALVLFLAGLILDQISVNRRLLESIQYEVRRGRELSQNARPEIEPYPLFSGRTNG